MTKLKYKLFIWLGKSLFKDHTVWGRNPDEVDTVVFTSLDNWAQKYKYSKRELGIRTPKRLTRLTWQKT